MNREYFTIFICIFLPFIFITRVLETYLLETNKIAGVKFASWTKQVFGLVYLLIIAGSLAEYFIVERNINVIVTTTGIVLLTVKMIIKFWAAKSLGKYWSHHVEIRAEHELIKSGPYKYIRHPAYSSAMLDTVGIPLVANAYYTVVFAVILRLIAILLRVKYEEKALVKKFGEEYERYRSETGALFPSLIKIYSNRNN